MKRSSLIYNFATLSSFTLIAIFAWAWIDFNKSIISPVISNKPITIEINKGDSFEQITNKLLAQNLIFKPIWFNVLAVQKKVTKKIKTGEFELSPGMTLPQVLEHLVYGKRKQYSITFPEGRNFKEILQITNNNLDIEHCIPQTNADQIADEISLNTNYLTKFDEQNISISSTQKIEGLIFPDTYFFEKHTTDIEILKRAFNKMQNVLTEQWQNKADNIALKSPYEALILASIIEKETAQPSERSQIAGVFTRRIKSGMLLQTDPTVIYGMNEKYNGNISHQDLITYTPYNTYIIKGLPPTPIAMPGLEAIKAALHPDQSSNIYFVAKGDGSHQFSPTLAEHNQAVNNFQRSKNAPR